MLTTLASDADVLAKIEAFCEANGLKPTTFGRLALGDGNLVSNLKAERSLTLKTAARVLDFIATYQPANSVQEAA
ncbi:hypothetical protein ABIC16_002227 [Sphingomonas sp. PvP055]|uniref:hypothetical protein n=1 Tax=Sphingomonas sp. PvP055 TaxID=3156391 RepID=UPI0033967089